MTILSVASAYWIPVNTLKARCWKDVIFLKGEKKKSTELFHQKILFPCWKQIQTTECKLHGNQTLLGHCCILVSGSHLACEICSKSNFEWMNMWVNEAKEKRFHLEEDGSVYGASSLPHPFTHLTLKTSSSMRHFWGRLRLLKKYVLKSKEWEEYLQTRQEQIWLLPPILQFTDHKTLEVGLCHSSSVLISSSAKWDRSFQR